MKTKLSNITYEDVDGYPQPVYMVYPELSCSCPSCRRNTLKIFSPDAIYTTRSILLYDKLVPRLDGMDAMLGIYFYCEHCGYTSSIQSIEAKLTDGQSLHYES